MKKIGNWVSNKTACNDSGEGQGIKELAVNGALIMTQKRKEWMRLIITPIVCIFCF